MVLVVLTAELLKGFALGLGNEVGREDAGQHEGRWPGQDEASAYLGGRNESKRRR